MGPTSISPNVSAVRPLFSPQAANSSQRVTAAETATGISATSSREIQSSTLEDWYLRHDADGHDQHPGKRTLQEEAGAVLKPVRRMDEIMFAYNFRGDLRIQFMDSVSKLVYQTPPVLFARMTDIMATTDNSVDMTI